MIIYNRFYVDGGYDIYCGWLSFVIVFGDW